MTSSDQLYDSIKSRLEESNSSKKKSSEDFFNRTKEIIAQSQSEKENQWSQTAQNSPDVQAWYKELQSKHSDLQSVPIQEFMQQGQKEFAGGKGVGYDYKGAIESGVFPTLQENGEYHWGSQNPKTGSWLKGEKHPTRKLAEEFNKQQKADKSLYDAYRPEEKTSEELKKMSISEKLDYAKELTTYRELAQSKGFLKGAASGASFSGSEYIPGMKPEEEDLAVGLGKIVGSSLPISLISKIVGAPLLATAALSPVAKRGLLALARMTGMGISGAVYTGISEGVQGEIPDPKELLKEGATWAVIDGVLQATEYGAMFGKAMRNIATAEGITAKEAYEKLWKATKNAIKTKFGRDIKTPEDIKVEDIKLLAENAKVAEKDGLDKAIEVKVEEVEPKEVKLPEVIEVKTVEAEKPTPKPVVEEKKPEVEKLSVKEVEPKVKPEEKTFEEKYTDQIIKTYEAKGITNLQGASDKRVQVLKNAVEKNEYNNILDPTNKIIRSIYQEITGNKLPNTIKGTKEFFDNLKKTETEKLSAVKPQVKVSPLKSEAPKERVKTKKTVPPAPGTAPIQPTMGTKQAAKRSDIIELFRKAFNDPIRLGKFRQRASGIHKMWPKVTRLLHANDVETAAHEIGHNLHTTLYGGDAIYPEEQVANVVKALRPYLAELKPLSRYEPFTLEGFAEFTRMYVTNPDSAKKLAPKFYAKFETDLEAQYPELKNALLEAREYYDTYLKGTPESRIDAQTSFGEDQTKLDNITEFVKENLSLDKLKTEFLDDLFPAKRAVAEAFGIPTQEVENLKDPRNLYRSLRVLKGAIGKADVFTIHETFDARTLKKTGNSLRSILKQLKGRKEYKEFNRYLIARRSIEKEGQKILTGINLGDAIAVEQVFRPKYEKLAGELDTYNDALLKYARDSGLLSNEQYNAIKKNNMMYAPFQRVMDKKGVGKASTGAGLQAGKPIKRMKGSTRDIIAPIESVIKNTYSIIISAEKNISGQVMANLSEMKDMGMYIERVPTPVKLAAKISREEAIEAINKHLYQSAGIFGKVDLTDAEVKIFKDVSLKLVDVLPDAFTRFEATTYPAGENIITVFYGGKPRYYEVSPEIYEMWSKGIAPYTADLITKILRIPARTLRAGAILNPIFMQKNFIRDTWGGFLFTKYGKSIKDPVGLFTDTLYSPLSMMAQAARKGPLYVEWLKSGGGMSTMQSLDRTSVVKKLQEIKSGYKPYQVVKWLRQAAEITEEANRLAEYGRALAVEGQTRLGKEIAAFASRDLSIDFAKMGLQTKALNQIIPFFNATIQGGDKLIRSSMNKDDRAEFLVRGIGFVALPALIFAWLNRNDDRVKEFQEQEKDFNFITFVGNTAIKIPVPFETGVILNGLTQRMYNYMMTKDPEAFEGFMGSVMSAMLPSFIPAFANPLIEVQANKSFFTGARIVPMAKEGLISKYQYKNYTSTTARLLGRAMAYMLGQETRSKAASPIIIDHFINSWGAGLGRLMISISDASLEAAGMGDKVVKPNQSVIDKLGLNAFGARYPRANTSSIEKFYDNYQDAISRERSFNQAKKMDIESPEAIEEGYRRMEKIYDLGTLKYAYKAIQSCQKEINNIWNDPSISAEEKKQMIDDLYLQQIEFAKACNEDIKLYRLSNKDD